MLWLFFYLSVFSDSFIQPVLASRSFKLPGAVPVENGKAVATVEDFVTPVARESIDLSTSYWEGKQWHYKVPTTPGAFEEFSIHIIDHVVPDNDPDYLYNGTLASRDLVQLDPRANWVCEWMVACFDVVHYGASVSANQINAAVAAARERLNANNGELQKRLTDGVIVAFSVGIVSGIASWAITNRIQVQNTQAIDTCNTDDLNARLDRIEDNLRNIMAEIQAGDSRPRLYDRFSEDESEQTEGQHLKHSVTPTQDRNDYKSIGDC